MSCYKNGGEHLYDELAQLDILIHLQVLRFRERYSHRKNDNLPGICIEDADVDQVLKNKAGIREKSESGELINQVNSLRERIQKKIKNSLEQGVYLPLIHLARVFQLSPFEQDILLVCLAPEIDARYEKLYAYLQDDMTDKSPSVNFILDLLCSRYEPGIKIDARACFLAQSSLIKYDLIQFIDVPGTSYRPLLSRCLKPDDRVVNFILEQNAIGPELLPFTRIITTAKDGTGLSSSWVMEIVEHGYQKISRLMGEIVKDSEERPSVVFYFQGEYGIGKKSTAKIFCHRLELPLIIVDMNGLLNLTPQLDFPGMIKRLFREALLLGAVIYLDHFDRLISDNPLDIYYQNLIAGAAKDFAFITFIAGKKQWEPSPAMKKHPFMKIEFPVPSFQLRKQLWQMALNGNRALAPGLNIDEIANAFQFTPGQIQEAAAEAKYIAMMRETLNKDGITMEDLYRGCRDQSNHNLSKMAQKITPHYTWSDIVLPPDKFRQLREMCNYVKYRHIVYHDWGFDHKISLGKGLNILFSGPSGTGKTMAAEIIAHELNLDLYKIDLSCVVSKYIGETEKNLSAVFKEAETANAVLFFDEADALFGKRSEVKDAHDRYANIEINYLLQKMEEHEGIVILATNFRQNIDETFTRRLHFSLDFPFPDDKYRLYIWQKIFPSKTPKKENIDFDFLARWFKISGGHIKNIALGAAFLAADNSKKVDIEHIILAAKREYQKMGKRCEPSDFGKYSYLLKPLEVKN